MADPVANQRLKIEAHDASRVEWSIYIPLPHGKAVTEAEVDLRLEFPENIYAPHDGWDHLQILARLSSPDEEAPSSSPLDFDGLRRSALGVARRMKLLRESVPRAAIAHSLEPAPSAPLLGKELERTIEEAVAQLALARASLLSPRPEDTPELRRERALADEFLSGQLLEMLTAAEEICGRRLLPSGLPGFRAVAILLRARIGEALAAELSLRAAKGEHLPAAEDKEGLALFLDRAAQLKKHFQEVLFLEPESKMVDQEWRNLVGLGGAATAFIIYFALQMLQTSAAGQAGLSVGTLITVGAVAYALKDRMKELTRQWLAGKLSHLYANRVLTLREPARFEAHRNVVLRARESLAQDRIARPDPLNPGTGAEQRVVTIHYNQRARVTRLKGPTGAVFERVKLVFRYDLAPILNRLDDSVKRVPVLAAGKQRVRFADAPRLYRVPMALSVTTPLGTERREALIVLQRHGIARIVPAGEQVMLTATPDLPELDDLGELAPL